MEYDEGRREALKALGIIAAGLFVEACRPVVDIVTPTPTRTPEPTVAPVQLTGTPTQTPITTPTATPTRTPEPTPSKQKDEIDRFLENPEVSSGFNELNYRTAREHVRRTEEVMYTPEAWEAFRLKIIQEDYELGSRANDEDVWDKARIAQWNYMWDMVKRNDGLVPVYPVLDSKQIKSWFSGRDVEMFYRRLWALGRVDLGADPIKTVGEMKSLYDEIINAYNTPNFRVRTPWGREIDPRDVYDEWLVDRANNGWRNTVDAFRKADAILAKDKKIDLLRFTHGYMRTVGGRYGGEANTYAKLWIAAKSLGTPLFYAASAPADNARINEWVVSAPHLIQEIRTVLAGEEFNNLPVAGVSLFIAKKPMLRDGSKYLQHETVPGWNYLWKE